MQSNVDVSKLVLTDYDRKLLNQIIKKPGIDVPREKVLFLWGNSLIDTERAVPNHIGEMVPLYKWHITHTGEQYICYRRDLRRQLLLKSFWLPLLVAFLTTLITNAAIWLFRLT